MKALVATSFESAPQMRIEDRPMPEVRPGHSLVRVDAATVNPLSNQIRAGKAPATAPLVLSNDDPGTVERGDRLPAGTHLGIYGGGARGITEDGGQQLDVSVADDRLVALPDTIGLDEGAALPVNYLTAHQALTRVGAVRPGQTLLISGASGSVRP